MSDSILIVAGESSGDLHGSALVNEIKKLSSELRLFGVGGINMQKTGFEMLYHSDNLNFLGFVEIVRHIPFIKKVQRNLIDEVIRRKTKYAILIDYPGFNLSLAKKLNQLGVKIFYYISPQVWAWGKSRIHNIRNLITKMFVLFPFEEEFYKKNKVDAEFVGHPLISKIYQYSFVNKDFLLENLGLDKSKDILLLMPGSRKQEVELIFPEIYYASEKIADKFNLQIVVACSNSIEESYLKQIVRSEKYKIVSGYNYDLMKHSKFGIIKSGTSTLEAGLLGLPMIIVYKANYLSYLIGMILIKVNFIGIVNILLGKQIVPELIQSEVNEKNIVAIISSLLSNPKKIKLMKQELSQLSQILGNKNAAEITAQQIVNFINEKN
jgi:lipid-A-disaccharide synthase